MRILFVAPRSPEPARVGYQVRAVEQLRRLAARHAVTFVAAEPSSPRGSPPSETSGAPVDRWVTTDARLVERAMGAARALRAGVPLQCGIYDTASLHSRIARLVAESRFDLVHVQLARLAPAVERALPSRLPRVIDLIDALSLNMRRRADRDRLVWRWLARIEAARLAALERALLERWDHATVVTARDRDAIGAHPRLSVNRNGVDLARFPYVDEGRDPNRVVFTGNLGYFPNVDAIRWFVTQVWPRVIAQVPSLRLELIGARPSAELRRLTSGGPGIELVGPVEDLAARLARAAIAIAPLQAGSGQPLKVLEAFAAGTPVVATPVAVAGLRDVTDAHLRVATSAADFAEAIVALASDPVARERLAGAARALVERSYGWDEPVAELEAIWERAASHAATAPRGST